VEFELNEEQRYWQATARSFAEEEIRPLSLARDAVEGAREPFDWEIVRKGSRLGFRTLAVPKEWGGQGADFVTQALVMGELARADSAIAKTFSQCWKASHRIASGCTQDQRERFLKPFLADDEYLLGGASTEPNAGSDNRMPPESDPRAGWRLRAERDGDEWVLNGDKCFIANGSVAKLFFVSTRTNPDVGIGEGTTVFLVPRGTPGFRVGKVFNKLGWRFYQNAELIFENVRVPHANVVGEVNRGARARASGAGADFNDLELAANAVGVCRAACESAVAALRPRRAEIAERQGLQLKLSRMHMLTEALHWFVMRGAWEVDRKVRGSVTTALVMNFSADAIQEVTRLNLDIHGAAAGGMSAAADKLARDAIIWTHLASDSVQRMKAVPRLLA